MRVAYRSPPPKHSETMLKTKHLYLLCCTQKNIPKPSQTNTCHVLPLSKPTRVPPKRLSQQRSKYASAVSQRCKHLFFHRTLDWANPSGTGFRNKKSPDDMWKMILCLCWDLFLLFGGNISKYLQKVWRNKSSWRINTPRKFNSSPPLKKTAIPKGNDRVPIINFQGLKC